MDAEKPINAEVELSAQSAVPANFVCVGVNNPIAAAFRSLYPWSNAGNPRGRAPYPGPTKAILAMVEPRAGFQSVMAWQAGRRKAPRWLVKLLYDTLQSRREHDRLLCEALIRYRGFDAHEQGKQAMQRMRAKIKAAKLAA